METVFFIGAFILLAALIYGSFNYRYRDREPLSTLASKSCVIDIGMIKPSFNARALSRW